MLCPQDHVVPKFVRLMELARQVIDRLDDVVVNELLFHSGSLLLC